MKAQQLTATMIHALALMMLIPYGMADGEGFTTVSENSSSEREQITYAIISTDKNKYNVGEEINLRIHIENRGTIACFIQGDYSIRYRITRNGEIVEDGSTIAPGLYGEINEPLGPGQTKDYAVVINEWSHRKEIFQKPGKYTVQISWAITREEDEDPWGPGNLVSNVVEFEILSPGGEANGGAQQSTAPPQTSSNEKQKADQTPSAQSAAWPWYTYVLIAIGVLIIGGTIHYLILRHQKINQVK